jgi:hypothetical protein
MRSAILILAVAAALGACTKVITTPMRVVGSAVSIVPVAGSVVDGALGTSADVIDLAPF